MSENDTPLVSIYCTAYNHRDFIRQAIESFLMQNTNFNFEIVIGEDCSTDGTREIVFEYEKKHKDTIRVITSDKNVGMRENNTRTLLACRGKYLASCDGDDYFISPFKLQKQVDFMESHPDYSFCFHNALILWDDKRKPPKYFCSVDQKPNPTTEDIIAKWQIPTASMLMRSEYLRNQPDWYKNVYNGDWARQLILSTKGKINYIDEVLSVYRKNDGGISRTASDKTEYIINKQIELLNNFDSYSDQKFSKPIATKIKTLEGILKNYKLKNTNKHLFWLFNTKAAINKTFRKLAKMSE